MYNENTMYYIDSMKKMLEDSQLSYYFDKLDQIKMLSRAQETELLLEIEASRDEFINKCSDSPMFRMELLGVLKQYKPIDISKVTRVIDNDSSKSANKDAVKALNALRVSLADLNNTTVRSELISFKLSGNIIHALINQIKNKFEVIRVYENDLKKLLRYFECTTEDEMSDIIDKIKKDKDVREYYQLRLYTTGPRLLSRCQDYVEYQKNIKKSLKTELYEIDIKDLKTVYKIANENEFRMLKSRNTLVEKNLRLVVSRAKKFINKGVDFEDLIQEGNIGLLRAINKHDSSRGVKIATYATWWIDQAIRRAISNKRATVRIPTHIEFLQTTLLNFRSTLVATLGREPTNTELAEKAGIDVEKLNKLDFAAMHRLGIDDENESGMSLLDLIIDTDASSPFETTSSNIMRERVRQSLSLMTPTSEKIVRLRFGIGEPVSEMTLQEIADKMKLSKMGVKLSVDRSLKLIKNSKKLDDFKD